MPAATQTISINGAQRGAVEVHTLDDLAELSSIEPAWKALRERAGLRTPNNHPTIYRATVEAMADSCAPHIVVCTRNGSVRGMILARRSRRSVACRIGYLTLRTPKLPCLDVVYGGLLCDDDAAVRSQMIRSIHDLIRDGKADHVMVNQLPDDHPLSRELRQPSHGCVVLQPRPSGPHHRFALAPGQFSETLARFSRKHRYNLRRADRLIVDHFAGDVTLSRVQVSGMVDLFHQEAARISAIGYQGGIGAGLSDSAATRHLLHAAASAGLLRCYALRAQGEMIAYQAGFVVDDIYHLLATGFLPRYAAFSPGQVLLIRVLEDLCAAGIRTIDYGFGDAAYKRTYGNDSRTEATLHLYAWRPCALVGWVIDRAAASMVARSANLIASRRIGRPIKTFWRDRLARAA